VWKVSLSNGTVNQQSLSYTSWISGQPNFSFDGVEGQSCMAVCADEDYQWNDDLCSRDFCSLCEVDP